MTTSESITNIAKALALTQKAASNLAKDKRGYGYNYVSLDAIIDHLRPIMAENGLSVAHSQQSNGDLITVETILMHTSGEFIKIQATSLYAQLKGMNHYQSVGSAITYLRRYSIASLFNIASEEDTDGKTNVKDAYKDKKQEQAVKKETLGDYLKKQGVNAKSFCTKHKIKTADQAQMLLDDKETLNQYIKEFKQ